MRHIKATVEITATPAHVWSVLTDYGAYQQWNPFITKVSGGLNPGGQLRVTIQPPGSKAMTLTPALLAAEPERELRWIGAFGPRGMFSGEHRFLLTDIGLGCTSFEQPEDFRGWLVPALPRVLDQTLAGFRLMNDALKLRCETTQL